MFGKILLIGALVLAYILILVCICRFMGMAKDIKRKK